MEVKKEKLNMRTLQESLKECIITESKKDPECTAILVDENPDLTILSLWKLPSTKVPDIFLHQPVDLKKHVKKLLSFGINFYKPYLGTYHTKITCQTFNDHKLMTQYFDKYSLPYHTFGHPTKRKLKVIIKGLPQDIDLLKVKDALKAASIPIIRIHRMHVKKSINPPLYALAVVPFDDKGKKLLQVKKIFGHIIKMEPPKNKTKQCHRCQKWGHSQRYCRGTIKCVKCAGDHISKKCTKDPAVKPKCANCGEDHTANYRKCSHCPDSRIHKKTLKRKLIINAIKYRYHHDKKNELVTVENCSNLYRNIITSQKKAYLKESKVAF